jgi:LysR family transcriptional regulator, carnitine catabolism transcriptional activator
MAANNANLKQLRAFVVISDKGSFVAASAALNLSQPALSQCVRQLEDHIGSPLFNRTTRSVHLTPLGMGFLPHARELLSQFDTLMSDMQNIVSRKHGRVTIACLPSVASRLMPRVLAVNERRYPGIHVTIRDSNMKGVTSMLMAGEADFGIGSSIAEFPELDSVAFAKDEMHVVLPVTSPLARKRTLKWTEIVDQPFIAMSHDTGLRELVEEVAQKKGVGVNLVAEVSNLATLNGMIEEGIGISALPSLALPRNNHSFLRHRPLTDPKVERTIRLYWKSGLGLSPAASAIISSLQNCIKDDRDVSQFPNIEWDLDALKSARIG